MGRIVTMTGISGSGKTAVVREVMKKVPRSYMVTSLTTRSPRDSDNPNEYFYVRSKNLTELDERGELLWRRAVGDHDYATSMCSVERALHEEGSTHFMILAEDCVKRLYKHLIATGNQERRVIPIFLLPPPEEELQRRLNLGKRDLDELVARRGDEADWEGNARRSTIPFRFVSNDRYLSETVAEVLSLL